MRGPQLRPAAHVIVHQRSSVMGPPQKKKPLLKESVDNNNHAVVVVETATAPRDPSGGPHSQQQQQQQQQAVDKPPDFVVKLYAMLSELPAELIAWRSGRIAIPGPATELEGKLPRYFRHGKFTSFQRQLNNFGFHKRIAESSSKLRVYCRDDMVGYPAEAVLELRRAPGGHGCAEWRGGAPNPALKRGPPGTPPPSSSGKVTPSTKNDDPDVAPPASSLPRVVSPKRSRADASARAQRKHARCVSLEEEEEAQLEAADPTFKVGGLAPPPRKRERLTTLAASSSSSNKQRRPPGAAPLARVVSTASVADLLGCLEREGVSDEARAAPLVVARQRDMTTLTSTATSSKPPLSAERAPRDVSPTAPQVTEEDDEVAAGMVVPDRLASTNTIGTFAIPTRATSGPLLSDLSTFRWVDRTASEASFRAPRRDLSTASLGDASASPSASASASPSASTSASGATRPVVARGQHSWASTRSLSRSLGLASFADLGERGVDEFVEFLDRQVCGAVLSSDSVDLSKSRDLNLELGYPDHLVAGDDDLPWGWHAAASEHSASSGRAGVARGSAPVYYFDD